MGISRTQYVYVYCIYMFSMHWYAFLMHLYVWFMYAYFVCAFRCDFEIICVLSLSCCSLCTCGASDTASPLDFVRILTKWMYILEASLPQIWTPSLTPDTLSWVWLIVSPKCEPYLANHHPSCLAGMSGRALYFLSNWLAEIYRRRDSAREGFTNPSLQGKGECFAHHPHFH